MLWERVRSGHMRRGRCAAAEEATRDERSYLAMAAATVERVWFGLVGSACETSVVRCESLEREEIRED